MTDYNGVFPDHVGGVGLPAGRFYSSSWISADGEFFIFGGQGGNSHLHNSIQHFITYIFLQF